MLMTAAGAGGGAVLGVRLVQGLVLGLGPAQVVLAAWVLAVGLVLVREPEYGKEVLEVV